jgi:hypothetical protein
LQPQSWVQDQRDQLCEQKLDRHGAPAGANFFLVPESGEKGGSTSWLQAVRLADPGEWFQSRINDNQLSGVITPAETPTVCGVSHLYGVELEHGNERGVPFGESVPGRYSPIGSSIATLRGAAYPTQSLDVGIKLELLGMMEAVYEPSIDLEMLGAWKITRRSSCKSQTTARP